MPDWAIGRFGGLYGKNRSISLRWTDAPAATESFTVVMVNDSYTLDAAARSAALAG